MYCRELGSHAWCVYLTPDTSRMRTVRVKQEEEVDKNNNKRVVINLEERNVQPKGRSSEQGLTSTKDLTIELLVGRDSPYHRLD